MGPRSFDRGNAAAVTSPRCRPVRFNGAAVIRPRKCVRLDCRQIRSERRFNGAAVIRPRKYAASQARVPTRRRLQWGRGHSTAEIDVTASRWSGSTDRLQWGRGHSTAEMRRCSATAIADRHASMGPRSFNRGNTGRVTRTRSHGTRFNGAAVIQPRKCGRRRRIGTPGCVASMGPRSFNRGNRRVTVAASGRRLRLQWGRGLSTAEMSAAEASPDCRRFNGAAVFQPRKWPVGDQPAGMTLQWGRGHSTAEMRHAGRLASSAIGLQWGRGHSTAEMRSST